MTSAYIVDTARVVTSRRERVMKIIRVAVLTGVLIVMVPMCTGRNNARTSESQVDKAIDTVATAIAQKSDVIKDSKIGIFDFTTIDGTVTPATKQVSTRLLGKLVDSTKLIIIERSELDKILKAQEIEQTGIVDTDTVKSTGGISSIDVMITGTLVPTIGGGELSVKVTDISSGRIYTMTSVAYPVKESTPSKSDKELAKIYREHPDKLDTLNRTYNELIRLGSNRPAVFLLAMLDSEDLTKIDPKVKRKLMRIKEKIFSEIPKLQRRVMILRKNISLLREYTPERYNRLSDRKKELIKGIPEKIQ